MGESSVGLSGPLYCLSRLNELLGLGGPEQAGEREGAQQTFNGPGRSWQKGTYSYTNLEGHVPLEVPIRHLINAENGK
jgi:hypothetical protein